MIKKVIKTIFELICLVILLPFLLILLLQIREVRQWMLAQATHQIEKRTQIHLTADDFYISPFLQLKIPKITLEDAKGILLQAEAISISWSPFALLEKEILISEILIEKLTLNPLSSSYFSGNDSKNSSESFQFPVMSDLPISIEIAYFQINQAEVQTLFTHFFVHGSFSSQNNPKPNSGTATLAMNIEEYNSYDQENMQLQLTLAQGMGRSQGKLEGFFHDLGYLGKVLKPEHAMSGSADFKANFSWDGIEGGHINFHGLLNAFTIDQIYCDDATVALNLNGNQLLQSAGNFSIIGQDIRWDGWPIDQIDFNTDFTNGDSSRPFELGIKASWPLALKMKLQGSWGEEKNNYALTLSQLTGKIAREKIDLLAPWHFNWSKEGWHSLPLKISAGESSLELVLDASKQALNCFWEGLNIPLEWLTAFSIPTPLSGTIDFHGALKGTAENPEATHHISFYTAPKIAHREHLPPLTGDIDFLCNSEQLEMKGNLTGLGIENGQFYGNIPVTWRLLPFQFEIDQEAPLHGGLSLNSNLTALFDFFSGDETLLTGDILLNFQLTGTKQDPQLHGKGEISNGHFESLKSGAVLERMTMQLESRGREISIVALSGNDLLGGNFNGRGRGHLDENFMVQYIIDFQLHQLHLLNLDRAKAAFDGQLQLKGNLNESLLTGQIATVNATAAIPEEIPETSEVVDVTYIHLPKGEQAPTYQSLDNKPKWPVHLDFQLQVPQIQISGSGLQSDWKANIRVQGNNGGPQLFGEASVRSGQYLFRGKNFSIDQGTITFAGEPDKKTSLYLVATHDINDTLVEAILRGPIGNPGISFRSSPPMSQQEILSWILFGRGSTEISAVQGAQLHRSVTNLKDARREAAKGPNVLSKIQDSLGIDRIDIQRGPNAGGEQVLLQVGKHFSNGLYFSLNRNFTNNTTSLSIEAKLMRHLKLQAEISDNEDDQLMIKWKRDY